MLVHNYCSPPSHPLFYPPLTFLDLVFLHKIFVKTYNWSALGVFVDFLACSWVDKLLTVTLTQKKKKKNGACYYYIYSSQHAAPILSSLAPQGRLKRLFTVAYSMFFFLRGYHVIVPYISTSNTLFNLLHLFAWCLSLHPITDKDIDKWLNRCSYWVIIGL